MDSGVFGIDKKRGDGPEATGLHVNHNLGHRAIEVATCNKTQPLLDKSICCNLNCNARGRGPIFSSPQLTRVRTDNNIRFRIRRRLVDTTHTQHVHEVKQSTK